MCVGSAVLVVLCWCVVWCCGVCCLWGSGVSARAVARGYLGRHGPGWRSLRLRGVGHHLVGQRGGVGGERGGERGAFHDPIVLTIVANIITIGPEFRTHMARRHSTLQEQTRQEQMALGVKG